jgi:integrase/recombinase XerC
MKQPTILPKYLTQEQLKQFFFAIPRHKKRDRALFLAIYRYGLRVSEAADLLVTDVDFHDSRINVERKKNGVPTHRRLYDDVKRAVRAYLREREDTGDALFTGRQGNLGVSSMQKLFKRYASKAGLDPVFSLHCLRHSIAVHSLETDRVDIRDVQDLLGHRAIQNTQVYAQVTDKRRSQADRLLQRSREVVKL